VYMDREQRQDHDEVMYQEYLASQEINTASLEDSPSKSMLDHSPPQNCPELQTAPCTELYGGPQPLQNPQPLCVFNKVFYPVCMEIILRLNNMATTVEISSMQNKTKDTTLMLRIFTNNLLSGQLRKQAHA
jgi:hypothetical protein